MASGDCLDVQSIHGSARHGERQRHLQPLHGPGQRQSQRFVVQSVQRRECFGPRFGQRQRLQRELQRQPLGLRLQPEHGPQRQQFREHLRQRLQWELRCFPHSQFLGLEGRHQLQQHNHGVRKCSKWHRLSGPLRKRAKHDHRQFRFLEQWHRNDR